MRCFGARRPAYVTRPIPIPTPAAAQSFNDGVHRALARRASVESPSSCHRARGRCMGARKRCSLGRSGQPDGTSHRTTDPRTTAARTRRWRAKLARRRPATGEFRRYTHRSAPGSEGLWVRRLGRRHLPEEVRRSLKTQQHAHPRPTLGRDGVSRFDSVVRLGPGWGRSSGGAKTYPVIRSGALCVPGLPRVSADDSL